MSRDWLAVYPRLIHLPKFRRLPDGLQLTLLYVWCLASDQTPEATWSDGDALGDALSLYGRLRDDVATLLEARWLDMGDDGAVSVHDWDEHQFAATKQARNQWEASYKRDWRKRRRDDPKPTAKDEMRRDEKRIDKSSNGLVSDASMTTKAWGPEWGDFLEAWQERYPGREPSEEQRRVLWPIIDARPTDAAKWLREARAKATPFEVVGDVFNRWTVFRSVGAH